MMNLNDILSGVNTKQVIGNADSSITDVQFDSRKIQAGALFIAISGTQSDGPSYIGSSVEKGAIAVVCEQLPAQLSDNVC